MGLPSAEIGKAGVEEFEGKKTYSGHVVFAITI